MATGMGLNIGAYSVIERLLGAPGSTAASRRSSRRAAAGNVSGHQTSRCRRPPTPDPRQLANASQPRHATANSSTAVPSTATDSPSCANTTLRLGRCHSRNACQVPHAAASTASGHAHALGNADASVAPAASRPIDGNNASSQREGRHSSEREVADALHECGEFGIVGTLVAHEPVPERIVLGVQQA